MNKQQTQRREGFWALKNIFDEPKQEKTMNRKIKNIFEHKNLITPSNRALLNGHRGAAIWLTGLSGSGKSTLAQAFDRWMSKHLYHSIVIDGDNKQRDLCSDLGFSLADRSENIRRVSELVRLYVEAGMLIVSSFISPMRLDRARANAKN